MVNLAKYVFAFIIGLAVVWVVFNNFKLSNEKTIQISCKCQYTSVSLPYPSVSYPFLVSYCKISFLIEFISSNTNN